MFEIVKFKGFVIFYSLDLKEINVAILHTCRIHLWQYPTFFQILKLVHMIFFIFLKGK